MPPVVQPHTSVEAGTVTDAVGGGVGIGVGVDTHEFRRTSAFSRALRQVLKLVILPLSAPERRGAYRLQFDEASRNVEIAAEHLARLLLAHPVKGARVLGVVRNWLSGYFSAQRSVAGRERYLIYTQLDDRIPFVPEEDTMYTYMLAQIAYVARELAERVSVDEMGEVASAFIDANRLGTGVFLRHPTVMPRFLDHDRLSLKTVQRADEPLNCCPSLHIAYSILLDNIAEGVLAPRRGRREVFDSIRYSTIRMFNSVLYTKQHSLIDVGFGILCARLVFERRFAARLGRPFNDFVSVFDTLRGQHPHIPYDEIAAIYAESARLHRQTGTLCGAVGAYLERHAFARVRHDDDIRRSYFDTEARRLMVRGAEATPV